MEENSQETGTALQVVGKCFAEASISGLSALRDECAWALELYIFGTTGDGALSRICIPEDNGDVTLGRPLGGL